MKDYVKKKTTTCPTLFVEGIKIGALDLNGGDCTIFFTSTEMFLFCWNVVHKILFGFFLE